MLEHLRNSWGDSLYEFQISPSHRTCILHGTRRWQREKSQWKPVSLSPLNKTCFMRGLIFHDVGDIVWTNRMAHRDYQCQMSWMWFDISYIYMIEREYMICLISLLLSYLLLCTLRNDRCRFDMYTFAQSTQCVCTYCLHFYCILSEYFFLYYLYMCMCQIVILWGQEGKL